MKTALITGVTGQDGSYLAELLLKKGYKVFGVLRKSSSWNTGRVDHLCKLDSFDDNVPVWARYVTDNFSMVYGDLMDGSCIARLIYDIEPDEVYNLGAQAHVRVSFDQPELTMDVNAMGNLRILASIESLNRKKEVKFYQASSCHDSSTLLVTTKGLKKYEDITLNDLAYTLNTETGQIEIKGIKKIITQHYSGEMIKFGKRRIDLCVTPNHRMFLQNDVTKEYSYVLADQVKGMLPEYALSIYSVPFVRVNNYHACKSLNVRRHVKVNRNLAKFKKNMIWKMSADDLFYLLGLYIGDGFFSSNHRFKVSCDWQSRMNFRNSINGKFEEVSVQKNKKTYESNFILFAIPITDPARVKLKLILDKNSIEYHEDKNNLGFSSWSLAQFFKLAGKGVYNKKIPDLVYQYKHHLDRLLEGLIDSDGSTRKDGTDNKSRYFTTTSKQLFLDLVRMCFTMQLTPSVIIEPPGQMAILKNGRAIVSTTETYRFTISKKRTNKIYSRNIQTIGYNGNVWCLEIEGNHNFLVCRNGKFSFSGNSEMFGNHPPGTLLDENSTFCPCSPYAVAKTAAYWQTLNYRNRGIFAVNGILFNHESSRRGATYVTRKITRAATRIYCGLQNQLSLGNLDAERDWGYAPEYVNAMYEMMQADEPGDFVVATGKTKTVREFLTAVFDMLGLDMEKYVKIDKRYFRPLELHSLCGDSSKVKDKFGWEAKTCFDDLVKIMVESDMKNAEKEKKQRP